ncbi:hypothetical protein GC096_00770 [Paenibacillus sp. LMG 31461]|uniref:Amino acid transporter n=1 Tax=Paenibacillus plantarum TaxID=2654975 RepID=A0ABX1X2F5_9BACL|nr:hypothetical protein [Paenibacillus plantarum]NOU62576.1 hypothetical protein [Paenibacillus plantarum]
MSTIKIHETQTEKERLYNNDNFVNEDLRSIQNIEGGGPIKRIDLNTMPRPLKAFGYFFFSILVLFGATTVLISFLR